MSEGLRRRWRETILMSDRSLSILVIGTLIGALIAGLISFTMIAMALRVEPSVPSRTCVMIETDDNNAYYTRFSCPVTRFDEQLVTISPLG